MHGTADESPSVCTQLSFNRVKELLSSSKNTSFLSLPQYWMVYQEFADRRDNHSVASLQDKSYVELLDTLTTDLLGSQHTDIENRDTKSFSGS